MPTLRIEPLTIVASSGTVVEHSEGNGTSFATATGSSQLVYTNATSTKQTIKVKAIGGQFFVAWGANTTVANAAQEPRAHMSDNEFKIILLQPGHVITTATASLS